jgi:hypothetical protein
MSQVRRHDNVQLGPEDLLLSIVGGPGTRRSRYACSMAFAMGWEILWPLILGSPASR